MEDKASTLTSGCLFMRFELVNHGKVLKKSENIYLCAVISCF